MTDKTRIWRLPLPADWEPENYWCVSFQIPAGEDYVQALSGAIGLLTISKTFERDETHTGAGIVCKTWERALYLAPMSVNETCVPVAPIPIPDEAAAKDAAAAIFTQFYRMLLHELNTCAPTVGDCDACVDTLYATLTPYGASEAVRGALMRLCTDLNELTTEQREAYEEDCPFVDQFNALSDDIEENPYDWINKLSDWLFDWLNHTTDAILNDLNTTGGLLTGTGIVGWLENNGGIPSGGGASFGGDCDWEYEFDFTGSAAGWGPYAVVGAACSPPDNNYDAATYGGGAWNAVWHPCDGINNMSISLDVAFDFIWRGVTLTYAIDDYHDTPYSGLYTGDSSAQLAGFTPSSGSHTEDISILPATMTSDAVIVVAVVLGNFFTDAVAGTITNLVIKGRGANPFT